MPDQRFSRQFRLTHQADFDRVRQRDCFATDPVLVVSGCRNELEFSRLGIQVSRKVGNAVVRNRWKRLVRESFRTQRASMPAGIDFVVRPRRGAAPDWSAIRRSLPQLAIRIERQLRRASS